MTGPWDHGDDHLGGHEDPHHDDVPALPDEPASWSDDGSWSHSPAEPSEPGDHLEAEPPAGAVGVPEEHGDLPAEQPADWSGPSEPVGEPAPGHADWSGIVDPDGSDDPDPTDPAGWGVPAEDPFPPSLSLDVEPSDGGPWADPDLLGADPGEEPRTDPPLALLFDLTAADGGDSSDWASVESSDDPAIRSLAAYWRTAV
jgi:hypothetical protein